LEEENKKNDIIALICLMLFLGVCGAIVGGLIGVGFVVRVARHFIEDPFDKETPLSIIRWCAIIGCCIGVGIGIKGWFEKDE
jgi:hypothetical protein